MEELNPDPKIGLSILVNAVLHNINLTSDIYVSKSKSRTKDSLMFILENDKPINTIKTTVTRKGSILSLVIIFNKLLNSINETEIIVTVKAALEPERKIAYN